MKNIIINDESISSIIRQNNYIEICSYLSEFEKPTDPYVLHDCADSAVIATRKGKKPDAVFALMDHDFTFMAHYQPTELGFPDCALLSILRFANCAQSRKAEAQRLLYKVYAYELNRSEYNPPMIVPIGHSSMARLRKCIEIELKTARKNLMSYGIRKPIPPRL